MFLQQGIHHLEVVGHGVALLGGQQGLRVSQPGQEFLQQGSVALDVTQGFLEALSPGAGSLQELEYEKKKNPKIFRILSGKLLGEDKNLKNVLKSRLGILSYSIIINRGYE